MNSSVSFFFFCNCERFALVLNPDSVLVADSWFQVSFVLTTGVNSVFVLGYSSTVMVPLGWAPGVIGLILAAAFSLYASSLIAKLHLFGGKRHIRYRDLAGHIYGTITHQTTLIESELDHPLSCLS